MKSSTPTKKELFESIKNKCKECMGGPEQDGWRTFIAECTSHNCPIHSLRPYQEGAEDEQQDRP